jgi:phosphoribosylaminoimidazole-succinocarboxamide synthase
VSKLLYEGKAKQVYTTDQVDEYMIHFKDDTTAGNGEKHDVIQDKGVLNNQISCIIYDMLEAANIKTHLIKKISDRDVLVKKVSIMPLEVIVRNITAGSICKRLGLEEGRVLKEPIFELCWKNDAYHDPLINTDHAVALQLATREEVMYLRNETLKMNEILKAFFLEIGLKLVDFKVEFGKTTDGDIVLADEISPDTCRLWDVTTHAKLDKDVFRRNIGNVTDAYKEVLARLQK